jgi:hypothetical protein
MFHAGAYMIVLCGIKNLGFVLEPAVCFGMKYPVVIAVELTPDVAFFFVNGVEPGNGWQPFYVVLNAGLPDEFPLFHALMNYLVNK